MSFWVQGSRFLPVPGDSLDVHASTAASEPDAAVEAWRAERADAFSRRGGWEAVIATRQAANLALCRDIASMNALHRRAELSSASLLALFHACGLAAVAWMVFMDRLPSVVLPVALLSFAALAVASAPARRKGRAAQEVLSTLRREQVTWGDALANAPAQALPGPLAAISRFLSAAPASARAEIAQGMSQTVALSRDDDKVRRFLLILARAERSLARGGAVEVTPADERFLQDTCLVIGLAPTDGTGRRGGVEASRP